MGLQFPTRVERPGKLPNAAGLAARLWPEFLYHAPVLDRFFDRVLKDYAEYQFRVWDDEREEVVGAANSIPAAWDGQAATLPNGGLDAVVEQRFEDDPPAPNVLCAMQIVIDPEYRGRGLSRLMIERMAEIGRDHGLDTLIAPVRPTLKDRYPLIAMERYVEWRREDGTLFDPWLRTHERLGAKILKVAAESTRVPGTVAQWEEWADMALPESGSYVVPGALVPVQIDLERDEGLYLEPNAWMEHPPPSQPQAPPR